MSEDPGDEGMARGEDSIAFHTFTQESNLKQCQNCRTISLISHPSKIVLWVILNQTEAKAEQLLAKKEQVLDKARVQQ